MILDSITVNSKDDFDALYRLLYARGFLVVKDNKGVSLCECDNASGHQYYGPVLNKADCSCWQDLLRAWEDQIQGMNGIQIEGNRIIACTDQFSPKGTYDDLFVHEEHVDDDTVVNSHPSPLDRFKHPIPAKLKPMELDPFVAMYVNALSAVGIETVRSCQGHADKEEKPLYIEFANKYFMAFHNALWKTVEIWANDKELPGIGLKWRRKAKNKLMLELTVKTADDIYLTVIIAGQRLYENRVKIRAVRKDVADRLTEADDELTIQELTKKMIDLIKNI